MRKTLLLAIVFVLALGLIFAWAEQKTVTGKKLATDTNSTVNKAALGTASAKDLTIGKPAEAQIKQEDPTAVAMPAQPVAGQAAIKSDLLPSTGPGVSQKNRDLQNKAILAKIAEMNPENPLEAQKIAEQKALETQPIFDQKQPEMQPNAPAPAARQSSGNVVIDYYDKPVEEVKGSVVEQNEFTAPPLPETKWQPQYGEKGEITNPTPYAVQMTQWDSPKPEPSMIASTLLSETFHQAGWTMDLPPTGWTILDSGSEGTSYFYTDDWHKFYYSYTGWNDTVFATNWGTVYTETLSNDWLITPAFDLSAPPAYCSLFVKQYYDNVSTTRDSANIMISTDDGATWTRVQTWKVDQTNPTRSRINLTSYVGSGTTRIGFWHHRGGALTTSTNGWIVDSITVNADGSNLFVQDNNNVMSGWLGTTPPSGPGGAWRIIDSLGVSPARLTNTNDWNRRWSSPGNLGNDTVAALTYTSAGARREFQNDWMISPSFTVGASVACTLSMNEYWNYTSASSNWPPGTTTVQSHGYVKVQETTDGGSTWQPWITLADHNNVVLGSSNTTPVYVGKYSLNAFRGKTLRIGIQKTQPPEGGYDTWYLSHLLVTDYTLALHDVATTALNTPVAPVVNGRAQNINVRVTNYGSSDETLFDDTTIVIKPNRTVAFLEDFNSPSLWTGATPPTGWAILDSGKAGWGNMDWHAYRHTGWTGNDTVACVAYASSDTGKSWLQSPSINCGSLTNIHLTFNTYFNKSSTDTAWVYASKDNFATCTLLVKWSTTQGSSSVPYAPDYDLTAYAGGTSFQVGFKWVGIGYSPNYWYVDKVQVYQVDAPTLVYQSKETIASLLSLTATNVPYAATWTPSATGNYTMKSWTMLAGDEVGANDTMSKVITVIPHIGTGGPDNGYYSFADDFNGGGPAYSWIDISATGTLQTFPSTGDDRNIRLSLGSMTFQYYGTSYNRVFLSENGFLTFDSLTTTSFSNTSIPSTATPNNMIDLFWDDMKNGTAGQAYSYISATNDTLIISLLKWTPTSPTTTDTLDAQVILCSTDKSIKMQYMRLGPTNGNSHTIGIEGSGAVGYGLQYIYNGVPYGNTLFPPLAITYTYNPPSHDVRTVAVIKPLPSELIINGATFTPQVRVYNASTVTDTFPVYFHIANSAGTNVYQDSVVGFVLAAGVNDTVDTFPSTSLSVNGTYRCTTWTALSTDSNIGNDTTKSTFTVDQHYTEGGPDLYLYKWIDNYPPPTLLLDGTPPVYTWEEINGTTPLFTSDVDDTSYQFLITSFPFPFYGDTSSTLWITTNGTICVGDSAGKKVYSNATIPSTANPNRFLAPFWDDLYHVYTAGSRIYAQDAGDHVVVEWENMAIGTSAPKTLTFEVLLYYDGVIIFQYKTVGGYSGYLGELATIGIESPNFPPISGLQYLYNGTPTLNRLANNLAIKFYQFVPTTDVKAISYNSPLNGYTGTAYYPNVTVKNQGIADTSAIVTVKIIGPSPATTTVFDFAETTAPIPYGTETAFSFLINSWTPAAAGTYTCSVKVTTPGDEIANNNIKTGTCVILPANDVAAISYDAPKIAFVGTAYFPTVSVKNNGQLADTAAVTVSIYGPLPATAQVFTATETSPPIATGATVPFTFSGLNSWTPAATGVYACSVSVTTGGDGNAANDKKAGSCVVLGTAALPFSTDFEANNGGFLGMNEWEWGTPTLVGPGIQALPAHSPVSCWGTDLDANYDTYAKNILYSPAITLTGAPRYSLDFWMWYRFESGSYDGANVKISADSGLSWTVLTTSVPYTGTLNSTYDTLLYGQQAWWGIDTIWTPVSVDLTPYAGQTVILRFDQGSEGSVNHPGLYIDDFSISQVFADIAVNSIDAPAAQLLFSGSYPITATLENLGATPEILDSIVYQVFDATPSEIFRNVRTLDPLAVGTAQFTSTTNWLATVGSYSITVTSFLTTDGNPGNNSQSLAVTVEAIKPFPFSEDWETARLNLSDWRSFYIGSGNGYYYATSRSHSPTHCVYLSYNPYPRQQWIVSPPIDLAGTANPRLSFWESAYYWGDDPGERHYVQIMHGQFDWGHYDTVLVEDPATYVIPTGSSAPFAQSAWLDLSAYVGDTIRVMFETDVPTFNSGNWYLDDIVLEETPIDVATLAILAPLGSITAGVPFIPIMVIQNNAQIPVGPAMTHFEFWHGLLQLALVLPNPAVPPGVPDTVIFDDTSLAVPGEYTLKAYVVMAGDINPANDTVITTLTVNPAGYEYIPGDANMVLESYPPSCAPIDVVFLVNYFKGRQQACVFRNPAATTLMPAPPGFVIDTVLYASADVTGDCQVAGGDVTRLVKYFQLKASIVTCPDYPPIPPDPAHWLPCQVGYPTPARTDHNVIPTTPTDK